MAALAVGPPRAITVRGATPAAVAQYARYEVAFDLERTYSNPFDVDEVDARARMVSPSGKRITVPAFWYQGYGDEPRDGITPAALAGDPHWRVRFAPAEVGTYRVSLEVLDRAGRHSVALPDFACTPSASDGFVRATKGAAARTLFDSGRAFVPVGECLWMPRTLAQFDAELALYAGHGLNYFRFFTSHDSMFFFESNKQPVGRYDQLLLHRLDRLFEAVEGQGVYVMPCLEMFADFRVTPPYPYWDDNAYNRRNGGPCETVSAFFTDPEARRLYRSKLRYFIARYGYSTSLFCIQLFAEANYIENYDAAAVRAWHREMAAYLDDTDPYGHLVSTSMAAWDSQDRLLFAIPQLDLVLNEVYNANDFAGELAQDNAAILSRYHKPVFVGEMGITFEYFTADDPAGVHIHNAVWANPMSGGIGVPSFWWTSYIRERRLLPHLAAFASFARGEDFAGLRPVDAGIRTARGAAANPDAILTMPYRELDAARKPQTLAIPNDRHLDREIPTLPRNLHPRTTVDGKPNPGYNPLTLVTDFAADGAINIHPRWLAGPPSAEARLHVYIDDVLAGVVQYKGCSMDDWQTFLARSREACVVTSVPVPKGPHRIRLDNQGTLFVNAAIELSNYLKPTVPNARVLGIGDDRRAFLWVQNRDNTWWRNSLAKRPRTVSRASVELRGMRDGDYEVEWWDTYQGRPARRERATARRGRLVIPVADLDTDAACKVRLVADAGAGGG